MLNVLLGCYRNQRAYNNLLLPLIVVATLSSTMERERASDRPRRRDSKYTTNGWKEYRQYDSYQPSSFNARDKPPVQSIRRPTQSEYWDQRPSPVGNTSRDGISSSRSQRGSSATKGKERRLSSVPLGVGVVESEPSLATSGSRSSTRERSERHRLEADGKRRGLGSEDAVSEADNINARSQRRKSESSKLRVQTATNDIIKHNGMRTTTGLSYVRGEFDSPHARLLVLM